MPVDFDYSLTFLEYKDDTKDYNIGDICIDPSDNSVLCYTSSSDSDKWYINATVPKAEVKFELTEPKICKCCGATIHDKICEYCGVEYNYKEV